MRVAGALILVLGLAGFAAGLRRPPGYRSGAPSDSLSAEVLESPATPWICLGVSIFGLIMVLAPKAHD